MFNISIKYFQWMDVVLSLDIDMVYWWCSASFRDKIFVGEKIVSFILYSQPVYSIHSKYEQPAFF